MILPDTSAWVEYLRRTESAIDRRLDALLSVGAEVALTDPVRMELLAGSRDLESDRAVLDSLLFLPFRPATDFDGAALIYRTCREQGVSPRGLVDCMIASVAIRHHADVLTADRDLARIAEVMALRLDPASVVP